MIGGMNNRAMVNFQDTNSDGYLTLQTTAHQNYAGQDADRNRARLDPDGVGQLQRPVPAPEGQYRRHRGPDRRLRQAFRVAEHQSQGGHLSAYNHIHKKTDMDYVRLQGDLGAASQWTTPPTPMPMSTRP